MVLKITIFIFALCLFQVPLSEKYHKQIHKTISKSFDSDDVVLKRQRFLQGELLKVTVANEEKGFAFIAEVAACNLGGCSAFEDVRDYKSSEYFDVLLLADENHIIKSIQILDYFSDYGYEITSKKYLKKFVGKAICDFKKDTDEIDAISGATISSYALEGTLSKVCEELQN